MKKHRPTLAIAACVLALSACGPKPNEPDSEGDAASLKTREEIAASASTPALAALVVNHARLINADSEPQNWLTHGRNYSEDRFSTLDAINSDNVGELKLAWYHDFDTNRGQEATPIVVDGVMFTTSAWSKVQAFDAVTGDLLWQFDPEAPGEAGAKACCDVVNRGVALWDGKLFVGTIDGRLIALDAKTGETLWSTVTVDQSKSYTITGAPRVVKGKVIIGNGGAEFGVRGYVSAYDADSGELNWRFYTVPGNPETPDGAASDDVMKRLANDTWNGKWWELGGGGTVWDSMAYDPDLDLLYIGVGNGSPWNQSIRSPGGGDNLFLSSIIALRPDTGEYVWHYQETPGDQWDYTATQHMILADLDINGVVRKVIMQAPKNGFFYVLDRATGELISADPFVPLNWASEVDLETGRPDINPDAYYNETGKPWMAMPGPLGAHSWHPMSFNPQTGLVYLPAQELGFPYIADKNFEHVDVGVNLGVDLAAASLPQDPDIKKAVLDTIKGRLLAWDPVARKEVWRVEHKGANPGGVLSTAGNLVFQGNAEGKLVAYQADSGKELWSFFAQTGIVAPPVTFAVDGKQYVTVVAGWGGIFPLLSGEVANKSGKLMGARRVLTFSLDGNTALPASTPVPAPDIPLPEQFGDEAMIAAGFEHYHRVCSACHGDAVVSGGVTPDLRHSAMMTNKDAWWAVVGEGALSANGMVSFEADFNEDEIEAIRAYVLSRAYDEANAP